MTDVHDPRAKAIAQPIVKRRRLLLRRLTRRPRPRFEFDALAAYLGLLVGLTIGAASPTAAPILMAAATQLCVAGALESGRDGVAECSLP